jgi:hypothetical protein
MTITFELLWLGLGMILGAALVAVIMLVWDGRP